MGVRETAASGRPLWLIDLGREATLGYVVDGSSPGDHTLEITSFEKGKLAEISLEIDDASPANPTLTDLRDAEDLLANADLIRRHWPTAPVGKDAIELYDRALALAAKLDDLPLQRLILTQKARYLIFGQNRFTDARALLEQAVALPGANDAPQQALAWKTLSTVRYDLGEYQPAIQAGLSALDLYRQNGDLYWQGIVLGNLSSVYSETGRSAEALATAQEALKDAQQERDTAGVVYCLSQLADLYQQQGDLEGALRTLHQGLVWVSELGYAPLVEAEIQKDLGGLYVQVGNWEEASVALQRCIVLETGRNDPVSLDARGLLATALQHRGRMQEALKEDTAAIEIARQAKLRQQEADLLLKRAGMHLALDQQGLAEADIGAASALASQLASLPLQVEIALALGDAQFHVDAGKAAESYRNALRLAKESGEREEQSAASAGLARALARQGQLEDAAASIEDALKIVETSRGRLSNRELQVSYFSIRRSWYELAVDICMRLDGAHPGGGYAERAFAYTERARARSLLDTLDVSGYSVTLPVAQSDKVAALLESQTATAEQVQRNLLDRQSALVSYWIGEIHSYRWLMTLDGVRVDVLPPRSELERVILPLEQMLQNRRPAPAAGGDVSDYLARQTAYEARLQRGLKRVGSMLLSNLPQHANTIFVAADGCLRSLPFAALRVGEGAASAYALRKYNIFLEPSASVALSLKQHPALEQAPRIAIFADPIFSSFDSRVVAGKQAFAPAHLQRLTGSAEEARTITRYAPQGTVTVRTGFDASPEAVRSLSGASILHFATHTVSMPGHSEITGIALSTLDRRGREQGGVFWLKDIYALHLPLSLVVLSACNSGKINDDNGEGLNNLSYAFFFAGAHAVVGSLWSADDTTTNRLMDHFYYRLLVKQKPVPEALREAQLKMLADPQTKSPTVWASFVFAGWPAAYFFKQNIAEEHPSPSSPRNEN